MRSDLERSLDLLERTDLVRRLNAAAPLSGAGQELVFLIKHNLVQETAQESLLRNERRRLNRLVGQALEELYPERLDEYAVTLAQHFSASGDDAKALAYAQRAADAAARVYAHAEAITFYALALELAKRRFAPGDAAGEQQLILLYTRLGRSYEVSGQYHRARELYLEMYETGRRRGDRHLELGALAAHATILAVITTQRDLATAAAMSQQALALARELGDRAAEAKILWNLLLQNLYGGGNLQVGIEYGQESVRIARELSLREQLAYSANDLSFAYTMIGDIERASALNDEACALWRELDNLPMLSDALRNIAFNDIVAGKLEESIVQSDRVLAIGRQIDNQWSLSSGYVMRGFALVESGRMAEAIEDWNDAMRISVGIGATGQRVGPGSQLALLYGELGAVESGIALGHEMLDLAQHVLSEWSPWSVAALARLELMRGNSAHARALIVQGAAGSVETYFGKMLTQGAVMIASAQAELALAEHDYTRALTIARELVTQLERRHVRVYLPAAWLLEARALKALGIVGEARAVLARAGELAQEMQARHSLWRVLAARAELEEEMGQTQAAHTFAAAARAELEWVAAHTPPELRESFLATPDAARVIRELRE